MAIVVRAWRVKQLEDVFSETLGIIHDWMNANQLKLAAQKTEAVMLTRKKGYRRPTFTVEGQQITTKNSMRYFGIGIDSGRRLKVHEQTFGAKAMKTAQALSRILPNVGGSATAKR